MSHANPAAEAPASWPSCTIPPLPPARGYESTATSQIHPRYEDVAQNGCVQLTTLMPGFGAVWRSLAHTAMLDAFRAQRVLPIMRRIVIVGEPGPFSAHVPISCEGTWRLAREDGGDRIFLDMWLDAFAPHASTLFPSPPKDAERVLVARVHAEHVVTRPFDPPATRKVTRLDLPGLPVVPEDTHTFEEAEDLLAGRPLVTARELTFGMMHTDSNQHVNSLVYPRLFEEAAVQMLAARSDVSTPETLLARAVELRYRKPFFAGDRASIRAHVEPCSGEHRAIAVGAFSPEGSASKPSCTIAMWLG